MMAGESRTSVTIHVPIAFRRRGGRKLLVASRSVAQSRGHSGSRVDGALIKAVARAFRWRKLMESGTHATVKEIATAEKIDPSYIGRILRLTLLAPDIIEAILDGRQWPALTQSMMRPPPVEWGEQRLKLGG